MIKGDIKKWHQIQQSANETNINHTKKLTVVYMFDQYGNWCTGPFFIQKCHEKYHEKV